MTSADEFVFTGVTLDRLDLITAALYRGLPQRVVITLEGTLGAGKTRFCQSLAAAAGIATEDVTSPTFTIVQQYQAPASGDASRPGLPRPPGRKFVHIDAYRLADEDEFIELGGEEILEEDAVILIEWPRRIAGCLPRQRLEITIELEAGLPDAPRTLRLIARPPQLADRLRPLLGPLANRETSGDR